MRLEGICDQYYARAYWYKKNRSKERLDRNPAFAFAGAINTIDNFPDEASVKILM